MTLCMTFYVLFRVLFVYFIILFFLYCFLLFICVRLTCDLINATYLTVDKNNEFGIDEDAISRCLEGLEFETFCTVESPRYRLHSLFL